MSEVRDYIGRVIDRANLNREMFSDDALPSKFDKIMIIPFFGNMRSELVLSTLLLPRLFPDNYVIVLSWPGHSGLYTGISEFWAIEDETALSDLARHVEQGSNSKAVQYERLLLRYFDKVTTADCFAYDYFRNGFQEKYFEEFDKIEYSLPAIPSVNLGWDDAKQHDQKPRICLMPTKYVTTWSPQGPTKLFVEEVFWTKLAEALLDNGYLPIIFQNYGTYDLSPTFNQTCAYITERNALAILGVMRACDCVLDIFNGLSRYALAARCPYFICDERQHYFGTKDYVLDDLCGYDIPKDVFFSFAPMTAGIELNQVVDAVINRLAVFLPTIDRNKLPSTLGGTEELAYERVRQLQLRRTGLRFFSMPTDIN